MDVDHPAVPTGQEMVGYDSHEAGKCHQVDSGIVQHPLEPIPIGCTKGFGVQPFDQDAFGLGQRQPRRVGLVATYQSHFECAVIGASGIDERRHVRAATRYQNRDPAALSHDGMPTNLRGHSRCRCCR